MKKVMLISIVALAVIAAAAAVILIGVFYGQQEKNRQSEGAPDVKFITFEAKKRNSSGRKHHCPDQCVQS
jgi:flagellar basal body-associated protein FliL